MPADGQRRAPLVVSVVDGRGRPVRVPGLAPLLSRVAPARARGEVTVALVSDRQVRALNRQYRGIDKATDVLSFPCDDPCTVVGPDEPVTLGDVVIAPLVAEKQAAEYGHTVEEELNLLLVHGVLHLLGYDHEADEDAAAMQARERVLLEAWAVVS